jgi:hypothetical protein
MLRGLIYGALAVLAVVVLLLRASAPRAAEELPSLSGTTSKGASVMIHMDGDRIEFFEIASIGVRCRDGSRYAVSWNPLTTQGNVTYDRDDRGTDGTLFSVHERPDERFPHPRDTRADLYMSGRMAADGRSVSGEMWFVGDGPSGRCESGTVGFSARR